MAFQKKNPETIQNALNDYLNGMKVKDCEAKYGIGKSTLYRAIKEHNVTKREPNKMIDKDILAQALSDYQENNLTAAECAEKYGFGTTTLFRNLSKENIQRNFVNVQRDYDRDYFEVIDTEEKAYWLGFIHADGCIYEYYLEIGLKAGDQKHLEKFALAIGGDIDMVKDKKARLNGKVYPAKRIMVGSKKMYHDLKRYGTTERKSATLSFPDNLSKELISHYLRGYFDGDGCITRHDINEKTGRETFHLNLIATKPFLETFMSIVEEIGVSKVTLQPNTESNNMFVWKKNGSKQIKKVLDYLYKDATVYLDRKHDRYLYFCRLNPSVA